MSKTIESLPRQTLDLHSFKLQAGTTLIEASAGTGKTYTIQYIVLDLLLQGLAIDEILVVTFTELATQELRERLQSFLFEVDAVLRGNATASGPLATVLARANERLGATRLQQIVRRALLHSDEAAIYTIHGFCQRALQENAFAADVAFESELCAEPQSILRELVRDFQRRVNLELPLAAPKGSDLPALCQRAKELSGFLRLAQPSTDTLQSLPTELTQAAAALRAMQGERAQILVEFMSFEGQLNGNSYSKKFFADFEAQLDQLLTDPEQCDAKLLGKLSPEQLNKKFKKGCNDQRAEHPFFTCCAELLAAQEGFSDRFFHCFDSWFVENFNQYKLDHGLITYDDMISLLDRALRRSSVLRGQLRARYRAALVDEFQDTDARQYAIFRCLFAEAPVEPAAPRYFAMIGDPKQSIYGFRGADIEAYLQARVAADYCYTLPTNYRSEAGLIAATNAFFAGSNLGAAEEDSAGGRSAIDFESVQSPAHPSGKPRLVCSGDLDFEGLYRREICSNSDKAGPLLQAAKAETAADIDHLLQLSRQGHVLLESEGVAGPVRRALRPGDIAILVDQHREAAELQALLRRYDVLAVLSKAGDVYASAEAGHFLHFLRACLDPREAWIHVLFVSPLYGLSAAELAELSDAAHQQAHECFNRLGREWQAGASIGKIWSDFLYVIGARARILKRPEGERLFTNYLHLGELARELERREGLSPERLADEILERVKAGASGDDAADNPGLVRLESDADAVQILTLHSSKGLEFPVVFLPTLWQKTIKQKSAAALQPVAVPDEPDVLLELTRDPEAVKRRARSEILRLGYVALTRAANLCVYYNASQMPAQSGRSNHSEGWFDLWLRAQRIDSQPVAGAERFLAELVGQAPLDYTPDPSAPKLADRRVGRQIPDTYQITSYSSLARLSGAQDASFDPSVAGGAEEGPAAESTPLPVELSVPATALPLLLDALPGGMHTGTCVHEILELCDFTQPGQWAHEVRSKLSRHFPAGSSETLERRVESVLELLQRLCLLTGEGGLSLAQLDHAHCLHEMEFYFPVSAVNVAGLEAVIARWAARQELDYSGVSQSSPPIDGFLTGSIDLFFEQAGRYYVLDWKTNSPLPGQARDCSSYDRAGLHAQMSHGRYYLQALIYSVAAAAYLQDRLGAAFNWEQHMCGFIYCFVRGLSPSTGWWQSAFSPAEICQAAEALGQPTLVEKGDLL